MRLSIVILNWNGSAYLQRFLPVLLRHTPADGVEVVVADNGSTDDSLDVLERGFPSVRVMPLERNYGFAEGYDKALFRLESDYFLLLNSDVEVTEGWLQPLLDYMDAHRDVAACQPKIRAFHRRTHFEYAGAAGGFIDRLGYPFCRGRVLGTVEEDRGQYDAACDVFWASGACLLVRAKDFWEAGALDAAKRDEAKQAVVRREMSAPTVMPGEIALPHGRTDVVDRLVCAVGIHKEGFAAEAPDDQPTRVVILMLVPPAAGSEYIAFLGNVSRTLMDAERRAALVAAMDRESVLAILRG